MSLIFGSLFLWLLVAAVGVGLMLLVLGRRGRRVDDHPVCARCRFDLSASVWDSTNPPTCPECGCRRLPRVGNRVRRDGWTWGGALLLGLSLLGVGGAIYGGYNAAALASFKPLWLLKGEARYGSDASAGAALWEMLVRVKGGAMPTATTDALFSDVARYGPAGDAALATVPRGAGWDDLAAELMLAGAGAGSDAERRAVAKSWGTVGVEVRPRVVMGEAVPVAFAYKVIGSPSLRYGLVQSRGRPTVKVLGEKFRFWIGGGFEGDNTTRGDGPSWGRCVGKLRPDVELPTAMETGRHELTIEVPFTLRDGKGGPVLVAWTETRTATVEWVESGGDPVFMRKDDVAGAALSAGLTVGDDRITATDWGSISVINLASVPAPIAYRVTLRRGGREWPFGSIATAAQAMGFGFSTGGEVPDALEDGALVDVVLTPDADVARGTTDLTEILDYPLVVEGVEIVR